MATRHRTPNAFLCFRSFVSEREHGRRTQTDVSKIAGVEWKALRPAGKRPFQQKAKALAHAADLALAQLPATSTMIEETSGHSQESTSVAPETIESRCLDILTTNPIEPQLSIPEHVFPIPHRQSLSDFETYNNTTLSAMVPNPAPSNMSLSLYLEMAEWGGEGLSFEDEVFGRYVNFPEGE
ncbi:hypothetical protein B0H16DRAFT_879004 [Mycena metata]|uniref:HMG box domain-containing protein n=1 Tax=Mycena metata TaxID=1033252 RepID=A0AAD7K465_9AGAR|nr:hypothetical protein B0H16DRAFT_879004 [Mycena metata]